jgi:hypothetical protein
MGNPIWITEQGDFGKIAAQQYFDLGLKAIDPDGGVVNYKLTAGQLPRGVQIDPTGYVSGNPERTYTVTGVPFNVNQDITSTFTIRATSIYNGEVTGITDRTFYITVTGNYPPVITSLEEPLGTYVDGTDITLQLNAYDLNNDTLTWKLVTGKLPPGLSLSETGLISGVINPIFNEVSNLVGFNDSFWNTDGFERVTESNVINYNFSASVTDGKAIVFKNFKITVYNFSGLTADSSFVKDDTLKLTADINANRPPILLTRTLGTSAITNSGGYYAFKFDGIDYDNTEISYILSSGIDTGFDPPTSGFDDTYWDQSGNYELPPGLTLDSATGWLTGYIPTQVETSKVYKFGISVITPENNGASDIKTFTITVLGNLDLAVTWDSPEDLGYIRNGDISSLYVKAQAKSNRELYYSLKIGSRLPQGIKLLEDGTISGRVSFQTMGFDKGKTTFDKDLASKFVYLRNTNFDNVYTFTVIAKDYFNQLESEKTFKLSVLQSTYEPYEDLFIKCLPSIKQRQEIYSIIHNTDIFDPNDIYRPLDPYYGLQEDIKFIVSYGIKASKLSNYIAAMGNRHFNKKFYFGDYKLAQGKDENGNLLYDVIYVDLIEDTKAYENKNGVTITKSPAAFTSMTKTKPNWRNPRAAGSKIIAPNDLTLMQKDIANNLENSYLNSLPEWMVSIQNNNRVLGYTTGAVLAYLKPGTGEKALFNIKKYAPYNIKDVAFVADRYILNNSYSANFDLVKRKFVDQKYTSFDKSALGKTAVITPVATVDYAVDRPFDSIHGKTLEYIIESGGLDGTGYNLQGKYIIFATQERFSSWNVTANDGWVKSEIIPNNYGFDEFYGWADNTWDRGIETNYVNVPGYKDRLAISSVVNQQGGVWKIDVDGEERVSLEFVRSISPGETLTVRSFARNNDVATIETTTVHSLNVGDPIEISIGSGEIQSVTVKSVINSITFTYDNYGENVAKYITFGQVLVSPQYVYVQYGDKHGNSYQLYDVSVVGISNTVPLYSQTNTQVLKPTLPTLFDGNSTQFVNNIDSYTLPLEGDKYLKFPKIGVFYNGQ